MVWYIVRFCKHCCQVVLLAHGSRGPGILPATDALDHHLGHSPLCDNILDATGLDIHLCACDPCGCPDEDAHHVLASAIIPRATELDLQETAGKGPVGRCICGSRKRPERDGGS